jgi:predicted DNA-binding ribbon-helix-helix protein
LGITKRSIFGRNDCGGANSPIGLFARGQDLVKPIIAKRSIVVGGHKTSVSLEDAFWSAIREIAHAEGRAMSTLIADIDKTRGQNNLSSAIRVFVLNYVRSNRER